MFRFSMLLILGGLLLPADARAEGDPIRTPRTTPRVYGPTGSLYGPTQAEYQYQRQYGRPWHYSDRNHGHHHGHHHHNRGFYGNRGFGLSFSFGAPLLNYGYPYFDYGYGNVYAPGYGIGPGYGSYGYGLNYYNPGFFTPPVFPRDNLTPLAPNVIQPDNFVPNVNPLANPGQFQTPAPQIFPAEKPDLKLPAQPSSAAAVKKSLEYQFEGDDYFRKTSYTLAANRYRSASLMARDRAEPYFRRAWAHVALREYDEAIKQFRLGLQLDPHFPFSGVSLSNLLGPENQLARASIQESIKTWARQNYKDPDRLFLVGVSLHFEDPEKARTFFEFALEMGKPGDVSHIQAFLRNPPLPVNPPATEQPASPPEPPADDTPPPKPLPPEPQPQMKQPELPRIPQI